MPRFGPLGDSQILSVSSASARATIGTVPTDNPAVALVGLTARQVAWYVKLGDSSVVAAPGDSMRIAPGSILEPFIIPIAGGETHIAIMCDGDAGDVVITPGQRSLGEFSPVGDATAAAVTQTDQAIALPTLPANNPAIRLVSVAPQMDALWVKLGTGSVVGSMTDSMRIAPGSKGEPTILSITNGETHISIFCEGQAGDVLLQAGSMNFAAASNLIVNSAPAIIGLPSGAPAPAQELTLSEVLDFVGSAAQGDILYRGAATWTRLPAGTDGQFLQTQGAAANPQWASVQSPALLASGSLSGVTTIDLAMAAFVSDYRAFIVYLNGWLPSANGAKLRMRTSSNNGSSYDTGASDYGYWNMRVSSGSTNVTVQNSTAADSVTISESVNSIGNATNRGVEARIYFPGANNSVFTKRFWAEYSMFDTAGAQFGGFASGYRNSTADIDGLQFYFDTGTISVGNYALYGIP